VQQQGAAALAAFPSGLLILLWRDEPLVQHLRAKCQSAASLERRTIDGRDVEGLHNRTR